MPIYEYQCNKCGERFELVIGPGEEPGCSACGSKKVSKLLSAPGKVGVSSPGGALQCGKDTPCCGAAEPCATPGCHKR